MQIAFVFTEREIYDRSHDTFSMHILLFDSLGDDCIWRTTDNKHPRVDCMDWPREDQNFGCLPCRERSCNVE